MSRTAPKRNISTSFRFMVELDGLQVAGFTEVSGLQSETEFEEVLEGGVNGYSHRLPKRTKYPPLVLKRGLSNSHDLWDWYTKVVSGKFERKSGAIIVYTQNGSELCRWNFFDSYPVKWIGPDLNSTRSEVAIESLEIVHNGLKAVYK